MRILIRIGIALVALAALAAAGYVAYWNVAASRMESVIREWAAQTGDTQRKVGTIAVRGMLDRALIADIDRVELARPGGALPWTYSAERVRLARPITGGNTIAYLLGPQTLTYRDGEQTRTAGAQADALTIELRTREDGSFGGFGLLASGLKLDRPESPPLSAKRISVQYGASTGDGVIPDRSRFAVRFDGLTMPEYRRGALGDTIEMLTFNAQVTQPLTGWDLPVSLARWRDAKGYVSFVEVALKWGTLDLQGVSSGVLRLDEQFRPSGGMNVSLKDFMAVVDAFHAARRLNDEARAAVQAALSFLGPRGGAGGRIGLLLEIDDGKVIVGPAELGTVAPILPGVQPPG